MNKKIYEDGYSTADIKICIDDVLSSKYNAEQPTFFRTGCYGSNQLSSR